MFAQQQYLSHNSLVSQCFEGCLKLRQIIWMVEFAYIVAIIQTSIALTRLEAHLEAVNIKLVIQNACLPFLRRAALLVSFFFCLLLRSCM
jgi:hypothetical protein